MIIRSFLLPLITLSWLSCSQQPTGLPNLHLIPLPQEIHFEKNSDRIELSAIAIQSDTLLAEIAHQFSFFLKDYTSIIPNEHSKVTLHLNLDSSNYRHPEEYQLQVLKEQIRITAGNPIGINRGIASLQQLILLNEEKGKFWLPEITVNDFATFQHRGLLLDCSRHFYQVEVVKKYIDLLAFYKMNTFHWHLTEDQGWRIQIDKYPRLAEIAAYRTEQDGSRYGGFYTKDEIRDVVEYASKRGVTIIPEIEMPGHSQAALAAYPQLSCIGSSMEVANDWGVFKEIYCAGNDSTFIFLEDVLTEVMELFPSRKIHIGGDEAPKIRWEKCPKCQRRIKEEGLSNEHELQSYFIQQIQEFLLANGRELIGWDEILEGGLAKGATVQSWRGMEGGIEAVKHGNEAIMSPTSHAYFDYDLDAIDLKQVYSFNPIPPGLSVEQAQLIIGGECNMWTERVPNEINLDSKVFPRIMAMAEVLWSDSINRDFTEFQERIRDHYQILEKFDIAYGRESIPFTHIMEVSNGKVFLSLAPYSEDIELNYSYHCAKCTLNKKTYQYPIEINTAGQIKIQPIRNSKNYGDEITIPVTSHLGIGSETNYENEYSQWYTAGGDKGLTDGKLGTLNFRDGAWQGFWGEDVVCTLELDTPTEINSISANFYQYSNSWIFIPTLLEVQLSTDGNEWLSIGAQKGSTSPEQRGKTIETIEVKCREAQDAKFVRFTAQSLRKVPS